MYDVLLLIVVQYELKNERLKKRILCFFSTFHFPGNYLNLFLLGIFLKLLLLLSLFHCLFHTSHETVLFRSTARSISA